MRNRFSPKSKTNTKVQKSRPSLHRESPIFTPNAISSFLNKVDVKYILKPPFFNSLCCEGRIRMERLLPKCDKALNEDLLMREDTDILNNVYFNLACKSWMEKLREGGLNDYLKKLSHKISKSKKLRGLARKELCHASDKPALRNGLAGNEETDYGEEDCWFDPGSGPEEEEEEEGSRSNSVLLVRRWRSDYAAMSHPQRLYFRAMLLDHGYYFRPSELQVAMENSLRRENPSSDSAPLGKSPTALRDSDTLQDISRFDDDLSTLRGPSANHREAPDTGPGEESRPRFIRVVLHRCPDWKNSPPSDAGSLGLERTRETDLIGLVQRLVSSGVRLPHLMPFPRSVSPVMSSSRPLLLIS